MKILVDKMPEVGSDCPLFLGGNCVHMGILSNKANNQKVPCCHLFREDGSKFNSDDACHYFTSNREGDRR